MSILAPRPVPTPCARGSRSPIGVHHIAVAAPNFDAAGAAPAERGDALVLSGTFSGIRVAYLPTDRDLGVLLEVFDGLPDAKRESDAT